MSMITTLYELREPDGEVRYVGKTRTRLRYRLQNHINVARTGRERSHRENWIRSVLDRGQRPIRVPVATVFGDGCRQEIEIITKYRADGVRLVSGTDGGEGVPGRKVSEETRRKISEASKGKKRSPEQRRRMSEGRSGKPGRRVGIDERRRISEKLMGHAVSEETRKKMSEARRGKSLTEEHKRKLSESHKKRTMTCQ